MAWQRDDDTSPEVARLVHGLLMKRTRAERLLMGCKMFASSRDLVRAGLAAERPWKDPSELRVRMFLRFYGHDFPPDERERIIAAIRERHSIDPEPLTPSDPASDGA